MSRSNPTISTPNPATRFFEWNGEKGVVEYYDRVLKKNIEVKLPFKFVLLDQLGTITGFNEKAGSGMYSNEVRDTAKDTMIVKLFKGGEIARGIYGAIKDSVIAKGGKFTANLYIAYATENGKMEIGSLKLRGAGLNGWIDFAKENRKEVYEQGVSLYSKVEGKKGKIVFQTPLFKIIPATDQTNASAKELDVALQSYLEGYFKTKKVSEQVETHSEEPEESQEVVYDPPAPSDDDLPF
jgi:hypothetical protein